MTGSKEAFAHPVGVACIIAAAMVAYGTTGSERKDLSACAMKAFSTVTAIAWRACASLAAA